MGMRKIPLLKVYLNEVLITLCTTPGCNDFELKLVHLMSHGMTMLMHMGNGAHVDARDEVHIV
jgi:hypothetical protein